MKRKAVLIGNPSGLQGVQVDITRLRMFLKSNSGGAWYESEIEVIENERRDTLLKKIEVMRRQSFDYMVVLFSGHGGQHRQTVLEINRQGEKIDETELRHISDRQLNIYDCCRSFSTITKSMDAQFAALTESNNGVRQRYDDRIMQAIPQQVLLYSCSIGQVSYDTPNGGVYLGNLLSAASSIDYGNQFKLVGVAHQEAIEPTKKYSLKEREGSQVPEAILPRCLSDQQLIISMRI